MYEIRRPITTSGPDCWENAATVSRHRTLSGAQASLRRQQRGSASQGGYSQDCICEQDEHGHWTPVDVDEEDEDENEMDGDD